jgi:iduronate 2-sulfatase
VYNFNDLRHYYGIPKIGPVPDEQARELIHAYYACVTYVDAQVGRLIAELDRLALGGRTIVVLWGDHGWQLGEHGTWDKHCNFETSTHSPLIVSVPGQNPGRTDALVEFVDIYPSLCELCGLPLADGLEGTSFAPLIDDPRRGWKSAAFSQYPRVIPGHGRGMGHSMRTGRYRLTEWTGENGELVAVELYDHQADPQENVNVAKRPENQARVEQLRQRLHAGWRAALPGR